MAVTICAAPRAQPVVMRAIPLDAVIVSIIATCVSLVWGWCIPFDGAPDERTHFSLALYIATHHSLPILDQSPGFVHTFCVAAGCIDTYATSAPGAAIVSAAALVFQHLLTGLPYDPSPFSTVGMHLSRIPDPFVFAARLPSALFVGIYVLFLAATVRLASNNCSVRRTALILGAFIPQVTFVGAYVNDDSFGLAAGAAVVYTALRIVRHGLRPHTAILGGLSVGALLLAKINYDVLLFPVVVALLLRLAEEHKRSTAWRFLVLSAILWCVAFAIGGWWLFRNALLYGDPTGLHAMMQAFDRIRPGYSHTHSFAAHGYTLVTLFLETNWARLTFKSFWGVFGYMGIYLPSLLYRLFAGLLLLGGGGLMLRMLRCCRDRTATWDEVLLGTSFSIAMVLVILLSAWASLTKDYEPQGRYLFSALVPLALGLAIGIHAWRVPGPIRACIVPTLAVTMAGVNIFALWFVLVPAIPII